MIPDRLRVPGAGELPPVRLSALRALIGDDETAVRAILRSFAMHSGAIANQLRAACAACQPIAASDAAHKLKSAARAIGAFHLAQLCAEIERVGEKGDFAALAEQLVLFNREEASVMTFLAMREEGQAPIL
jgi:HPt (histidine-containing phosphotransfer) domain-containing protein